MRVIDDDRHRHRHARRRGCFGRESSMRAAMSRSSNPRMRQSECRCRCCWCAASRTESSGFPRHSPSPRRCRCDRLCVVSTRSAPKRLVPDAPEPAAAPEPSAQTSPPVGSPNAPCAAPRSRRCSLLLRILTALGSFLGEILPVIHPVFPGVFTMVVVVIPRVVVHVAATVPAIGTVVVVVVHGRADRDARSESNQTRGNGDLGIVVFLNNHGGVSDGWLGIDHLRVVLRDVDDLRIGWLDDDHLFTARRRLGLDLLLLVALQRPDGLRLLPELLNGRKDRRLVLGERLPQHHGPRDLLGHHRDHLRKDCQRHETGIEPRFHCRVLQLACPSASHWSSTTCRVPPLSADPVRSSESARAARLDTARPEPTADRAWPSGVAPTSARSR